MIGAIRWFGCERDPFCAVPASRDRLRAHQRGETRPWSVSSARLAPQSREHLLHARDDNGAKQRACLDWARRFVHRIRRSCQPPLEVAREHVADASRQITHDRAASELRERSEQEGAHRNIDSGRRSTLLRTQPVFDLGARPRGAEPVSARSQDNAALHGLIADHARLAVERSDDRAELDRELPLQPIAARTAERGSGHARDHAFDLGQEIPYLAPRPRDDERLSDFNIGLFSRQTQIAFAEGGGRVIADGSSERHRSRAGDRPAVARAHRTKPPWLGRRRGEGAGATLLQHAANGAHDADISGAAAKVAAQLEADAPLVGSGKTADDVARGDQHSRRAESALQTMLGRERLPQRGHDGIVLEPLDGRDLRALAKDRIGDAGSRRLTVDQQRARTARALLAAQMRAGQTEPFAHEVGEVHARLYRLDDGDAVYGEAYGSHLAIAEAAARARAVMWRRAGVVSPARPSSSLAALSSRRTAAPGRGIPPKITRASAMTTGRPSVAPMAALKRSRSPSSNTAPLARANSPALRHTL